MGFGLLILLVDWAQIASENRKTAMKMNLEKSL